MPTGRPNRLSVAGLVIGAVAGIAAVQAIGDPRPWYWSWVVPALLATALIGVFWLVVDLAANSTQVGVVRTKARRRRTRFRRGSWRPWLQQGFDGEINMDLTAPHAETLSPLWNRGPGTDSYFGRTVLCAVSSDAVPCGTHTVELVRGRCWATYPADFDSDLPLPLPLGRYEATWTITEDLQVSTTFRIDRWGRLVPSKPREMMERLAYWWTKDRPIPEQGG